MMTDEEVRAALKRKGLTDDQCAHIVAGKTLTDMPGGAEDEDEDPAETIRRALKAMGLGDDRVEEFLAPLRSGNSIAVDHAAGEADFYARFPDAAKIRHATHLGESAGEKTERLTQEARRRRSSTGQLPKIAQDSSAEKRFNEMFPGAAAIRKMG